MDERFFEKFILENISDPVILTDDSGAILYVTPAVVQIFGYQPSEIMELSDLSGLTSDLLVSSEELDGRGEIANLEIKIQDRGGREIVLLANIKRVGWAGKSRLYSFRDITGPNNCKEELRGMNEYLERQLEKTGNELRKKTIALTEVLSLLEIEKQNIASRVSVNVQKLLLPIIDKLIEKASSFDSRYLVLVKQNLEELTSSVGIKLTSVKFRLTPKEVELCILIKGGFSIKEIAIMQNLSDRTVETHRLNIRKKLGITSSKINLATYLSQL